jgi:metal-responsive CopG/Arc/MetJ family transcriptional regulator
MAVNMRIGKTKEKRVRTAKARSSIRRVVVDFPEPLFDRAERVAAELAMNRSDLIRKAVEGYLEALQRATLERELAEGYVANASQARLACEEFAHADLDVV